MAKANKKDAFLAQAQSMQPKRFDPSAATADKLPSDIRSGKESLTSFMSIPVTKLVAYRSKNGFDFSRHTAALKSAMIESIKQYGVIEPLSVRPTGNGDVYEILAGESRWLAAKEAGLEKVPCRIMKVDDNVADAIFSATNLMRRDMSYRDRINGWWRYLGALKKKGLLNTLRHVVDEAQSEADNSTEEFSTNSSAETLGWRQIMRYHSCHNLIDEWVTRLDNRQIGFMTVYVVSQFPSEIQTTLLNYHFSERQAKELLNIYQKAQNGDEGFIWEDTKTIEEAIRAPEGPKFPRGTKGKIIRAVQIGMRPEDYQKADQVLTEALRLYYTKAEQALSLTSTSDSFNSSLEYSDKYEEMSSTEEPNVEDSE